MIFVNQVPPALVSRGPCGARDLRAAWAQGGAGARGDEPHSEAADALAQTPLFAGLPGGECGELAQHAQRARYTAGETLFYEGDEAGYCLLVINGRVEVLRYDAAGEERMLHSFVSGQFVADAAMFMPHGLYPMTARATVDTVAWRLPRGAFRNTCARQPAVALRLLESLSHRLYQRVNEVDWLTSSNAAQRLAAYLVAQADGREPLGTIELPTSQRHLAARLGIRAETLSRLLSEWQGKGWIRGGRRRWSLLDAAALRDLAAPCARRF